MATEIIKRFYENQEHTSIATIERFPSGKYYIQYGWNEEQGYADCSCGDFATAEEAEEMLMKQRPFAKEIKERLIDKLNSLNGKFDGYIETKDGALKNYLLKEDAAAENATATIKDWLETFNEHKLIDQYIEYLKWYNDECEVKDPFLICVDTWLNDEVDRVELIPENTEESKEGEEEMAEVMVETENFKIDSRDKELLDQMFSYMRDVKGDEEFITWAMENQGMTKEELKYYCDIDVETEVDRFRKYHKENDLICTDIAASIIELSGMNDFESEDVFEIHRDLENAIRDIQADAENPCSNDQVRVLWNMLCRLENCNEASGDTWYLIDGWRA